MLNILQFFEDTAAKYPQKTAVAEKDKALSFSELQSLAKRYGSLLLSQKLSNKAVAVFAGRSVDTLAMFLGVLYSGCYYVPLDPALPSHKLRAVLDDCSPEVILGTEADRTVSDSVGYGGSFFTPEDLPQDECSLPTGGGDDPLYMIYTSGSTGKPKGVLKSHRAMISFINAYCGTFDFSSDDIIGSQTPFFFDASAKDIYLMLKIGAALEILPTEYFSFPVLLVNHMNERGVTFISWVPSALCLVTQLNTFMEVIPQTLKKVFFVGEVFPMKQLKKWFAALPQLQYVNLYGSTEIAGICCYHEVRESDLEKTVLPMGRPLANCEIFLMDGDSVISEPEQVGEICISSDSLASGYYNDKAKTDAAFVSADGKRLFHTGDLAWYDSDGNLNFASRRDYQIKHMGRRIELGEIEAAADKLDEIRRCACLYNEAKKQIVLFCELSDGYETDGRAVQKSLRGMLSDYMVPGRVIVADALPLNANGKIDRQKLKEQL